MSDGGNATRHCQMRALRRVTPGRRSCMLEKIVSNSHTPGIGILDADHSVGR